MTHNIIKTENYLLVVDSEIKEGDRWVIRDNGDIIEILLVEEIDEDWLKFKDHQSPKKSCKKITSHLPLNNSPLLEGVPLLPPLEDEVKYLAYDSFDGCDGCDATDEMFYTNGYIKGYNKAKEKYKYTQEDILIIRNKLVSMLPTGDISAWDMIMAASNYTKWFDNYIQHLQQPKMPVGFECEDEVYMYSINGDTMKPKTTTNSQGHSVLVGTYKYE